MITTPDPNDRAAVLAALRAKLADVQSRQRQAVNPRELWNYACDLIDAIWSLEAELGRVLEPLGREADSRRAR